MIVEQVLAQKGRDVYTISPSTTVAAAARLLHKNKVGCMVVIDQHGNIAGMFSERDVIHGIGLYDDQVFTMPVAELMTKDVITCAPSDTLERLEKMMTGGRFRHLPVVEGGRLRGIVSIGDIVKNRLDEAAMEVDQMRTYVAGAH